MKGIKKRTEKKLVLRKHLLRLMVSHGITGLVLPVILETVLFVLCRRAYSWREPETDLAFALVLLIQLAAFLYNLWRFQRKIYKPWMDIERVIHGAATGTKEIQQPDVGEKDELFGLYQDLNSLLSTLEELAARESRAILMKKQAELDALQSQINPHFLYNTLESIRGQAMVYGIREIEMMTKALANLFRYSISNEGNTVPFSSELKNIENYLLIQQCRFSNKFEKIEKIDRDTLDCLIPKLLIQPLVENAIHHGLEPKFGRGILTIKAYRTNTRLVIQVIDDGLGIEEKKLARINEILRRGADTQEMQESGMRIGIVNVNERIRLAYGREYGLKIYSTENVGTNVEITLPVIKKEEGNEKDQRTGVN